MPVFSFGENDLYEQKVSVEGSWLHWGQLKVKQYLGFSTPIFHGRGIFNYTFGFLPYRKPIIAVGEYSKIKDNDDGYKQSVCCYNKNNLLSQIRRHARQICCLFYEKLRRLLLLRQYRYRQPCKCMDDLDKYWDVFQWGVQ